VSGGWRLIVALCHTLVQIRPKIREFQVCLFATHRAFRQRCLCLDDTAVSNRHPDISLQEAWRALPSLSFCRAMSSASRRTLSLRFMNGLGGWLVVESPVKTHGLSPGCDHGVSGLIVLLCKKSTSDSSVYVTPASWSRPGSCQTRIELIGYRLYETLLLRAHGNMVFIDYQRVSQKPWFVGVPFVLLCADFAPE